ncbi:alpha-L-rhamnosidase C-terminal domain-containing protein [Pelagicoccus enzymogenes]|uniref:alpha-L-rhamnosidase-related protein n=1 Tax=Pelagicoccus enzymogenes TaxID=2773457 RepID=UPI00280E4589|nr:alpha-L-rhamnosidase C-terminal domain-containing protein [Pelagicoccus enzymogenes]MDQ8198641.1 alpha-L-rhamnosidase C-terminal domain-containing protein [Pelagicoccus enzymogenes]
MRLFTFFLVLVFSAWSPSASGSGNWDGQWIWQPTENSGQSWVAFRKTFHLDEKPSDALASIAVDTKYWLWVNGQLVRFEGGRAGAPSMAQPWKRVKPVEEMPASEKPRNTWYQQLDLAPYLVEGENLVAVLVWHWGRETHKGYHIDSGQGGLYFQLELSNKPLSSDSSWKAIQHPAYDPEAGEVDRMVVRTDVAFDANKSLGDWTEKAWYKNNYNDTSWPAATEKGRVPDAPWHDLVLDDVPHLFDHGLKSYTAFSSDHFPFVSDGTPIKARLPANLQVTPYLVIESQSGGELITIETENKLNRVEAYYTTRPGKQAYEAYSWMNGHEVVYDIPAGVTVHDLKYRWLSVGQIEGRLKTSNTDLQRLWDMGANTLMVCARDNFMDCPDRERALWIGDVADQTSYLFYVMGDDGRALLRRAIRSTFLFSEDGSYGALGPLRLRDLLSQNLQFAFQCVWEYYLNTGDRETLEFSLPYIRTYLAKWEMGDDGLPILLTGTSPDRWNWYDWGVKETQDITILQTALYYAALDSLRKMADELGEPETSTWAAKRLASMKAAFDQAYWTGNYYSSVPEKLQDDRANAIAILSGLAGQERYEAIVENVLIPNHYCSPHFEWMVNLAMFDAGYPEAAIERMTTRYRGQIDREWLTTLYEKFPNGGSYNHAWNAPNAIIARRIAGIEPTTPGWKEFAITPTLLDIEHLHQKVPSIAGVIEFGWDRTQDTTVFKIKVPEGTQAQFKLPISTHPKNRITLNGKTIKNPTNQPLTLQPGTWEIIAK